MNIICNLFFQDLISAFSIQAFVWLNCSPDKSPSNWKPNTETTQNSIFSIFPTNICKCANSTEGCHYPENYHLLFFSGVPPVNDNHSKIQITGSYAPTQVECKDVSHDVSDNCKILFWNISHFHPCKVDEDREGNQNEGCKTDCSFGSNVKDKGPNDVESVCNSKENVSFQIPYVR